MTIPQPPSQDLYVPDRFEGLQDAPEGSLRTIVTPVAEALDSLDALAGQMRASRRGSLLVLRGESGSGKSTFLDTVGLFREGVETFRIARNHSIAEALAQLSESDSFRIVVLENREAVGDYSVNEIERDLHAINSFVRSDQGRSTAVVWPVNTDDLMVRLSEMGTSLGGKALFGPGEPITRFSGPRPSEFVGIAQRTISSLNEGASLAALGISDARAAELAEAAVTIGDYLGMVRDQLLKNQSNVAGLLPKEQFRMWTLVLAGNETEGDVAALTRGGLAYVDIERLLTSTGANIVQDPKEHPEKLGILGTMLDAKIINVDMLTILAVARTYGSDKLHELMRNANMSTSRDASASSRLLASELGLIMRGESLGTRKRGKKPGGSTQTAFANLASIARSNDGLLNDAVGRALQHNGLITEYQTEKDLGTSYAVRSDLLVSRGSDSIRLEVMWRSSAGRADIANYVLTKLGTYSRAIGLM